ncbi:MAG: BLUF domain-containing protein [Methylococcaceae bacterium]|nr:BLUF domain-containing protein [Methylococcaceae bacterium]
MPLNCLVYASLATQKFTDDQLLSLLKKARDNNERLDITGMLLYRDGFFMQVLEGDLDDIEELFDVIADDSRHSDIIVVYKKPIKQRSFAKWTMGFNKIDDKNIESIKGFTQFLKNPTPEFFKQNASEAEALLDQFKHQLLF